ncbi:MAG: bifunctional DedA family/phosphatase PAP2 family protein [Gemmatimonadota bacterium]|nr:bifunctional DedA family/phosphatase PAP2 family protein [Gemmatimonadota bacterium]
MHGSILRLVETYGYAIVFLFVAIESLGIPLPGETVLVTAGALAALGHLSLLPVIATAAIGAIVGDAGGYWIGRLGGLPLIKRYGSVVHFNDETLSYVRGFFSRHGAKAVFLGRFIALLRTWAALLAGTAEMPYGVFTLYNVLGGVTWAALFGTLGYLFGQSLPLVERYVGQASLAVVLLIALIVALVLGWRWFNANRDFLAERVSSYWAVFSNRHPGAARFIAARFVRGEYLGLHLTIGFLVSLAGLWLFAGITEDVLHHDPLTRLDLALTTWIRAHTTPWGDRIFTIVSLIGSPVAMAIVAGAGALLIVVRRKWLVLAAWVAAFLGAGILSLILKIAIQRPRPAGATAFLHGETFSFPSGHALGSLVGYGMLAYVIGSTWIETARGRVRLVIATAVLVLAIGISRLYLGVHYFSDVVGGYAVGVLWLSVCISGLQVAERRRLTPDASAQPTSNK